MQLSIIIPAYNCEKRIEKILSTIVPQMTDCVELLLIDDGSTDDTKAVCIEVITKYSNANIRYFFKENGGVSSARNFGIGEASGDYIAFIDADDMVEQEYIDTVLGMLRTSPDMCQFGYYSQIERKTSRIENKLSELTEGMTRDLRQLHYTFVYMKNNEVWNKVFKREIIEKENIRFDTKLQYGEDLVFCMEYSKHIKTLMVSRNILYGYIKAAESVTYQFKSDFIPDCIDVYKYIISYFDKEPQLGQVAIESVATRLIDRYHNQKEYRMLWTETIRQSSLYDILRKKFIVHGVEKRMQLLQLHAIAKENDVVFYLINCISKLYRKIRGMR